MESGSHLAHFRILELVGRGGMGEVYRAQDTRLERDVAIKILPDDVGENPDHLRRLEREATLLASLNDVNIASIYGIERVDDRVFLVLEYVDGPGLEERLADGGLPVPEALEIARQIASALEAAHAQGVIHRDLKPANVKLNAEDRVKVLDFGLAKALRPDPDSDSGALPDSDRSLTREGRIVGTIAYMSPE